MLTVPTKDSCHELVRENGPSGMYQNLNKAKLVIVSVFREMKGQGFFMGKGTDHAHGQVLKVLLSYCLMKPLILPEVLGGRNP